MERLWEVMIGTIWNPQLVYLYPGADDLSFGSNFSRTVKARIMKFYNLI